MHQLISQSYSHLDEKLGDKISKNILPHYDEIKYEKKGIDLDENGEFNQEKLLQLEKIKKKLHS